MLPFSTVTVKDLSLILNVSYSTARRKYADLRTELGVAGKVQARQLAAHWGCPLTDLKPKFSTN